MSCSKREASATRDSSVGSGAMFARLQVGDDDDDDDDEQNSPEFRRLPKPADSPTASETAVVVVVVVVVARALARNGWPSVERTVSAHRRHCGVHKGTTAATVALEAAFAVPFAAAAVAAVLWAWCLATSSSCSGEQNIDLRLLEGRELPTSSTCDFGERVWAMRRVRARMCVGISCPRGEPAGRNYE